MTRFEFMDDLSKRLAKKLSEQEIRDVMSYYNEYFDEAGPEREQEVIAEFGDTAQIAGQILSERAMAVADEQPQSVKKGLSAIWIVILSLFAVPVALPVAIALVGVMFGLVSAIIGIVLAFLAGLIAIAVVGVALVVLGVVLLAQNVAAALFYFGIGLACIGITLIFVPAVMWAANKVFRALAALFNKIVVWFRGRFSNDANTNTQGVA